MIGYARVSMSDQDNRRQIDDLIRFGVDARDIYEDKASGRDMKRPGWQAAWKDLSEGDLLVVHAIDRLGRDLIEVVRTVKELNERGCDIKVLSMDLDTRTPTGRLLLSFMAAMAQWEREAAFLTWLSTTSARGFDVAGTASRFEWRAAGHIKTSPAAVQLTTLEMAHRSGACQGPAKSGSACAERFQESRAAGRRTAGDRKQARSSSMCSICPPDGQENRGRRRFCLD
jgi:hypothetical protein